MDIKLSLESILLLNREISIDLLERKPYGLMTQREKLKKESHTKK